MNRPQVRTVRCSFDQFGSHKLSLVRRHRTRLAAESSSQIGPDTPSKEKNRSLQRANFRKTQAFSAIGPDLRRVLAWDSLYHQSARAIDPNRTGHGRGGTAVRVLFLLDLISQSLDPPVGRNIRPSLSRRTAAHVGFPVAVIFRIAFSVQYLTHVALYCGVGRE